MSSEVFIILAGPQPVPCSRRGGGSAPRAPPGAGNCPAPSFHGRRSSLNTGGRGASSHWIYICVTACWVPGCHPTTSYSHCALDMYFSGDKFPFRVWVWFFFLSDCNPILQIVYSLLQLDCIWHSDRY